MRLALPQLGVDTMPMMSGGSMIDSQRSRAPTASGPMSLTRAAVAPIIWRRMVMLGVVLAPPRCGRPRRP
jgi:hypothetical protein